LTLAKRIFIEYKTAQNDVNIVSDPKLHERHTHIILNENLLLVVKSALHEYGGEIIILETEIEIHPLLRKSKRTKVKTLKEVYDMRWESENIDLAGGQFFYCIIIHVT
jgi:hypothetical protein